MKQKHSKLSKFLALLLVAAMCFGLLPMSVFAADGDVTYSLTTSIEAGKEYLIVVQSSSASSTHYAMDNSGKRQSVNTSDGSITLSAEKASAYTWTVAAKDSYLTFENGGKYLSRHSGDNAIELVINTKDSHSWMIYSDGKLYNPGSNSTNYYLSYSSSTISFKSGSGSGVLSFYVKDSGTGEGEPDIPVTGDTYVLTDTMSAGKEYLIVSKNTAGSAFALKNGGSSEMSASAVTVVDGDADNDGSNEMYIVSSEPSTVWSASANGNGFNLSNDGMFIEGKSGKVNLFSELNYSDRSWTYSGSQLKHTGGTNEYTLYYNNGFTSTYNSSSNKIYIFEKLDTTGGDTPDTPVSGEVYTLADKFEFGKTYLIVNTNSGEGYALTNTASSSFGTAKVTVSDSKIAVSSDLSKAEWEAKETKTGSGLIGLWNGTNVLKINAQNSPVITTSGTSYNAGGFGYTADNHVSYPYGNPANDYFIGSDGNTFKASNTESGLGEVYIFVKGEAGEDPDTPDVKSVDLEAVSSGTSSKDASIGVGESLTVNLTHGSRADKIFTVTVSNTAAAKVEPSTLTVAAKATGEVTVTGLANGTATITFTGVNTGSTSGGSTYTATLNLTVGTGEGGDTPDVPPVSGDTYVLTDTMSAGKEYLIVSKNTAGSAFALKNGGSSEMSASAVTVVDGDADNDGSNEIYIVSNESSIVWSASANGNGFNLSNDGMFIEGKSGKVNLFSELNYSDRSWTYSGSQLKHTGGTNEYTLYYNNGFTSTYNSSSNKIYIFEKLDTTGGDTPDTPVSGEVYTLADKFEFGKTYLIVNTNSGEGYALTNTASSSFGTAKVTVNDGKIAVSSGLSKAEWEAKETKTGSKLIGLWNGTNVLKINAQNSPVITTSGTSYNAGGFGYTADNHVSYPYGNPANDYFIGSDGNTFKASNTESGLGEVYIFVKGEAGEDPSGDGSVNLAFISDIHNSSESASSGNAKSLDTWINTLAEKNGSPFAILGSCGDMGNAGAGSANTYFKYAQAVMDSVAGNSNIKGVNGVKGFYVPGNHEYAPGNLSAANNPTDPKYSLAGQYIETSDYILYSLGATQGNEEFKTDDINKLSAFLSAHSGFSGPIFVLSHYPLHYYSGSSYRESTVIHNGSAAVNSDDVIALLNNYPNVIFLWGHNHSTSNSYYDKITTDKINNTEIEFTYCSAAAANGGSSIQSRILEAKIKGADVTLTYYDSSCNVVASQKVTMQQGQAHVHSYTYEVTAEPSTEATGVLTGTCSCGVPAEVTLPKLDKTTNYTYSETKAATCTENGAASYTWKTTTYGNVVINVELPALDHDFTYAVTTKPTTEATGVLTGTCSRCTEKPTVELPMLDKTTNYTYSETKAATCTEKGAATYTWKTATYGNVVVDVELPALEHDFTYEMTTKPTAETTGLLTGTCSRCTEKPTVTLPMLNKTDYDYTLVKAAEVGSAGSETYTWKTTDYGEFTVTVIIPALEHTHSYTYEVTTDPTTEATGVLTGTCSCGVPVAVTLPMLDETNYTYSLTKAATCTEDGSASYTWKITTYGDVVITVVLPALDHDFTYAVTTDPTAEATGLLTGTCSRCTEKPTVTLPMLDETNYTYSVTKAATCTEDGSASYTWKDTSYGDVVITVVLPALGHDYKGGECSRCGAIDPDGDPITFTLVESIEPGQKYIIFTKGGSSNNYLLANDSTQKMIVNANDGDKTITISAADAAKAVWIVEAADTNKLTLRNSGRYMSKNTTSSVNTIVTKSTVDASCLFSVVNNRLAFVDDSTTNYLNYYSTTGSSSYIFNFANTSNGNTVRYYKLDNEPAPTEYTITATAGENGSISPSGDVAVVEGDSKTFTFIAGEDYEIDKVFIDGEEAEVEGSSYTFTDVTEAHTISVSFKEIHRHSFGTVDYKWNSDHTVCTATRSCDCGETETENGTVTSETTVKVSCSADGKITYTAVFVNPAFATQTDSVTVEKLEHTPVTDAAVAPTCTEDGCTEGSHCAVCKAVLVEQQVIKATGHVETETFTTVISESTCTVAGKGIEFVICKECRAVVTQTNVALPLAEHTPVTDAAVAPTCTEKGLTEGSHCSECKTVLVAQEVVPALGHDFDADGKCTRCEFANPFTDVPVTEWFFMPVMWAVENGITLGTTETTFGVEEICTRAQVVTFLYRAAGSPEITNTDNPFTDVSPDDYFYNAVLWAVENGITVGASETTFEPDETCTRAQIVTFLYRAAGSPEVKNTDNPFTDVSPDEYYYNAVLWAVENGITVGTTETTFEPDEDCTREQIVTFLYRWKVEKTDSEA